MHFPFLRKLFAPHLGLLILLPLVSATPWAQASSIVSYDVQGFTYAGTYPTPITQDSNVTVGGWSLSSGLSASTNSNSFTVAGWSTAFDSTLSADLSVSANPGASMTITGLDFFLKKASLSNTNPTTEMVAYRVDDGSGFGAWTFSSAYSLPTTGSALTTWNFAAPVTTSGTVQFGFFEYGGTVAGNGGYVMPNLASSNDLDILGTVTASAAPEPASGLLSASALLLVISRRRRKLDPELVGAERLRD